METINVPQELRNLPQWVNWAYGEPRSNGKRSKPPMIPGSPVQARINKPSNWTTFEVAHQHDPRHLGFVLTKSDNLICIDLDHLIKDGVVDPWALEIIKYFDSYTEISPSGTGLHIWIKASLNNLEGRKRGNTEIYETARYLTVTGNHIEGTPLTVNPRQGHLTKFHESVFEPGPADPLSKAAQLDPQFEKLYFQGDVGDFGGDDSAADWALLNILVRAGVRDPTRLDQLFRESALMRPKWDSKRLHSTYGFYTINRVLKKAEQTPESKSPPIKWEDLNMDRLDQFYGPVEWMWENWIPRGHITMIVGQQDVGKSYFGALLIAILGKYRPVWPDLTPGPKEPQRIYIVENENMTGVYRDRLLTLGAKSPWNFTFGPVRRDNPYECMMLDDPDFISVVSERAREFGADMILVDSLSAGHVLRENAAQMRRLLSPLTSLAADLDVPLVIIHHLRKRREEESPFITLDQVRGSTAITQLCRSVMGIWGKLDDDGNPTNQLVLQSVKSTFCKPPESIGMSIVDGQFVFEPGFKIATIVQPSKGLKIDLSTADRADAWLRDLLTTQGPLTRVEVLRRAKGQMGVDTVDTAARSLGVTVDYPRGKMTWELPRI